jgi:hypothetical protein
MSQHGLGLKKEGKKQNIDPVFNSSAVLFLSSTIKTSVFIITLFKVDQSRVAVS